MAHLEEHAGLLCIKAKAEMPQPKKHKNCKNQTLSWQTWHHHSLMCSVDFAVVAVNLLTNPLVHQVSMYLFFSTCSSMSPWVYLCATHWIAVKSFTSAASCRPTVINTLLSEHWTAEQTNHCFMSIPLSILHTKRTCVSLQFFSDCLCTVFETIR